MKTLIPLLLFLIVLSIPVLRRFFIFWFVVMPVGWVPIFLIVIVVVYLKRVTRKNNIRR